MASGPFGFSGYPFHPPDQWEEQKAVSDEDDIKNTIDGWSKKKQDMAYKYLYALGCRISR